MKRHAVRGTLSLGFRYFPTVSHCDAVNRVRRGGEKRRLIAQLCREEEATMPSQGLEMEGPHELIEWHCRKLEVIGGVPWGVMKH